MESTDVEWVFWRPVRHGLARGLVEVKTEWSVIDLIEAHQVLDVEADIEFLASEEANRRR